jgi:hypothetical protein
MSYRVTFNTPTGAKMPYVVCATDPDAAVDSAIAEFLDPKLGLRQIRHREELLATIKIDVTPVASTP